MSFWTRRRARGAADCYVANLPVTTTMAMARSAAGAACLGGARMAMTTMTTATVAADAHRAARETTTTIRMTTAPRVRAGSRVAVRGTMILTTIILPVRAPANRGATMTITDNQLAR